MLQLKNFSHRQGVHCSSTAIGDIARFDGIELSEPMVFGLGEGLGFVYYEDEALSPVSRFNGRASNFEEKFYQRIETPLSWQGSWQASTIADSIRNNRPIIAKTSIAGLPYYQPADFFGHGVLVVGLDENAEQVEIAESFSEELQHISIAQFKQAVAGNYPPFMTAYSYASAPKMRFSPSSDMIKDSITATLKSLLSADYALEGVAAMERAIEAIPQWAQTKDWQWHARFAYQSIEKRGTGGGNFRFLYADFIKEAYRYLPSLRNCNADIAFRESAEQWQALAHIFKTIFIKQEPEGFIAAAAQLKHIKKLEVTRCKTILKTI